ncbi:MAG: hypothetical protein AAFW81_09075 [Pseudomonadota bacterium]
MSGQFRGARGVDQLLKIARAETEALRIDLRDIESAIAGAAEAMAENEAAVSRERGADDNPVAFARFIEAMRERRLNISKTLISLEAAEETAREQLAAALGEIAKLERVAAINADEKRAADKRRETGLLDEAARRPRRALV